MKTIWNVEATLMNGTVTLQTVTQSFLVKELAEKAAEKVREANKENRFPVHVRVYESTLYEYEMEVPILNNML